ncbi:MAG: hypothetical protein ABIO70_24220 [Pseudomonadota bacterium]
MPRVPADSPFVRLRDHLHSDLARVLLSVTILASVLPFRGVERLSLVFFALFSVELGVRTALFVHDVRQHRLERTEIPFLLFDLLATVSFLPLGGAWVDVRLLRLLRLSRMVLLLGYWGPLARELWVILTKRERRYQLAFVGVSFVILSFSAAVLLHHFAPATVDFDLDGAAGGEDFWGVLWWSFRQLEDGGNLLAQPTPTLSFATSVVLTTLGLAILSFMVGISTSVVEELVALAKERRLGIHRHTVLCNIGPHSAVLLQELVTYYAKSLRAPRIATMGPAPQRYDYMHEGPLRGIRYRQGRALSQHDLQRVDVDRATRVILLGQPSRPSSDSEVISQVLSVRQVNPTCPIHAELVHSANVAALLRAGQRLTVPMPSLRFVHQVLAEVVLHPEMEGPLGELLCSCGDELYTCVYGEGALRGVAGPSGSLPGWGALAALALARHRVLLLGYLRDTPGEPGHFRHVFFPPGDPAIPLGSPAALGLCGFFGVADSFESMRRCGLTLAREAAPPVPAAGPAPALASSGSLGALHHLLVCGFHLGLESVLEQLLLRAPIHRVTLLLQDERAVRRARDAILNRARAHPHAALEIAATGEPGVLGFQTRDGQAGQLLLRATDWSHGAGLRAPDVALDVVDLVLLTWNEQEDDPDAQTALALLELLRRVEEGAPARRIVCEVRDGEKAALFRERFAGTGGGVAVVAAETLRSSILAQGVFVPGLFAIFHELLSATGVSLRWRVPAGSLCGRMAFDDLHAALLQRERLVLLGVELAGPGARRVVINPSPRAPEASFDAADLRGLLVVG